MMLILMPAKNLIQWAVMTGQVKNESAAGTQTWYNQKQIYVKGSVTTGFLNESFIGWALYFRDF